ncbi:class II aldolase/adducin family protein [Paludifilum halophilum]|uniref:Class II aldolase/adducin N-terminal domain-containing protein n=1 Tax=Paludifilum halophilum TaxID=1642702 RepID=A0A235B4P2_9BACL|nr:class II aldolase/adducin family protein [Paludifilum halophilum]OYD06929.1 hypothetical protein CHM34_13390 [Paludifilum halophilum]
MAVDPKYASQVQDLLEIGRRLYRNGFVASDNGNISIWLSQDRFLITVGGVSKGYMTEDHAVVIDRDGRVLDGDGEPPSEYRMHAEIYRYRKDVRAVVDAHPPTATAFTVAGISMMDPVLPEMVASLGGIPTVPFGVPGTDDLVRKLRPYLDRHDAVLLENLGAVTLGIDGYDAYYKMESVEMAARIRSTARSLGEERGLTRDEVKRLMEWCPGSRQKGRHPGGRMLRLAASDR